MVNGAWYICGYVYYIVAMRFIWTNRFLVSIFVGLESIVRCPRNNSDDSNISVGVYLRCSSERGRRRGEEVARKANRNRLLRCVMRDYSLTYPWCTVELSERGVHEVCTVAWLRGGREGWGGDNLFGSFCVLVVDVIIVVVVVVVVAINCKSLNSRKQINNLPMSWASKS